ncbi:Phage protein, partial [Dysosmobacter welbionis]
SLTAGQKRCCTTWSRTPVRKPRHGSPSAVCGRRAIPSRHTNWERHIRTGLAYRLTEKRRQSGFKNRRRPVILAPHTRWANCCWSGSNSRRPFTGCGRQRSR